MFTLIAVGGTARGHHVRGVLEVEEGERRRGAGAGGDQAPARARHHLPQVQVRKVQVVNKVIIHIQVNYNSMSFKVNLKITCPNCKYVRSALIKYKFYICSILIKIGVAQIIERIGH